MRNFYRIRNMHINMDSIHHFAWHRKTGELWLHDGNPQPIVFTDPDGSLYKALCNYVGNNTSFADNFTGNLRHKVYAVRGNDDPIFVGNFDSYENTLAFCHAHEWSADTISSEIDIPKGCILIIETHGY